MVIDRVLMDEVVWRGVLLIFFFGDRRRRKQFVLAILLDLK
jgi:hypothetical protein